jgi:flagellar hook assembly protein FlgD
MTITVGALDGKSLYNSKTLTLQKADTLSVLTLLNSPNPFDPKRETTTFHIELSQDADVSMTLYSLGLQKIKEFPTQSLQAGYHMDTTWDGKDENGTVVPNGVYVLLFKAVGSGQTSIRRYKVAVLRR